MTGSQWATARSWFGGCPRLGSRSWPRGKAGKPMMFVAQIDFAEIAERAGPGALPESGGLAFFIGFDGEGAAVPVTASSGSQTEPPSDAPMVRDETGQIFPEEADAPGSRIFPYWPIDITKLPIAADAEWEEAVAAVDRLFQRRQYFFSAKEAYKLVGEADRPVWWHGAQLYACWLRRALRHAPYFFSANKPYLDAARKEEARLRGGMLSSIFGTAERRAKHLEALAALGKVEARYYEAKRVFAQLEQFAVDLGDWVKGKPAWQRMSPPEIESLSAAIQRGRSEFKTFCSYPTPSTLEDIETDSLLALATAEDRIHAEMPHAIQTLINERYLLPTGSWHQMFGRGVDIQGNAAYENEVNIMLLQLVYDGMIGWQFGDMGAYQFWIPPEALAKRDWSAVTLTFECH